jgi:3-deoxy-manno-octulosonate cytidylyltransferase (CMP-KDO synthetase)
MMKTVGIIPARYASTRFPGKPLAMIAGVSMIERVYRQALKAGSLKKVIVATDDQRIADAVSAFGGEVVMTSSEHPSGTDRCAEVLSQLNGAFDAVVNIQGDEPFIHPGQIDLVCGALAEDQVQIATLVKKISTITELTNPNSPKVVLGANGDALYFSRQPIPFFKGAEIEEWITHHCYYKHIGIYGYRADVLPRLTRLTPGKLEKAESLEQLRWLEHGFRIRTRITELETIAVDTPADMKAAEEYIQSTP